MGRLANFRKLTSYQFERVVSNIKSIPLFTCGWLPSHSSGSLLNAMRGQAKTHHPDANLYSLFHIYSRDGGHAYSFLTHALCIWRPISDTYRQISSRPVWKARHVCPPVFMVRCLAVC